MRRYASHRMKRDWAPGHFRMLAPAEIGPFLFDFDGFIEGNACNFSRDCANTRRRDPDLLGHILWRILLVQLPLQHEMEHRLVRHARVPPAINQIGSDIRFVIAPRPLLVAVHDQFAAFDIS